jgi:hypothetical protein
MDPFARLSPSLYENLYHMGMVVTDLPAAMAEFGGQLGLTWAPVRVFSVNVSEGGGRAQRLDVPATYSRQGPPYLELIQATGDGLLGPERAGGLHHIGVFVDDVEGAVRRLEGEGMRLEMRGVAPDGTWAGPVYLANGYGLRVELGALAARDMVRGWVGNA